MLPYLGESSNVVFIPRKPHPTGIRVYLTCVELSITKRPVCYHILPDLRNPKYAPHEVLTDLYDNLPPHTSVSTTIDAYFGSISWLNLHHEDRLVTMALNSAHYPAMVELFSHQLRLHQYRTYTNGKVIVTVWNGRETGFHCQ